MNVWARGLAWGQKAGGLPGELGSCRGRRESCERRCRAARGLPLALREGQGGTRDAYKLPASAFAGDSVGGRGGVGGGGS
jgi:hypothetical protein